MLVAEKVQLEACRGPGMLASRQGPAVTGKGHPSLPRGAAARMERETSSFHTFPSGKCWHSTSLFLRGGKGSSQSSRQKVGFSSLLGRQETYTEVMASEPERFDPRPIHAVPVPEGQDANL